MTPQQLKNAILQQAIQGKLVEQRAEEGTGQELYKAIQDEKQQLIQEGKLKKQKALPQITEEEIPFEIPDTWKWCYIGDIFNHMSGKALNSKNTKGVKHKYITTSNVYWDSFKLDNLKEMYYTEDEIEKYSLKLNDLLVLEGGDVGRAAIWNLSETYCFQNHIHRLRPFLNVSIKYFYYNFMLLKHKNVIEGKGIGIKGLSSGALHRIIIPLPPLDEQKRIVEKIEELLPLVERYEKAWARLEELNKKFPLDMQKAILGQAIQGKLVEQRAEEGTGQELFEAIQEEKQQLIEEGKLKKQKALPEITEDEIPFEIPDTWKWVRLGESLDVRDGTHDTPKYVAKGYPLVTSKNLKNGIIDFDNCKYISELDYIKISERSKVDRNDILFAMIGSIGNPVLVLTDTKFSIKNMALFKNISSIIDMRYLFWFLFFSQETMKKKASGGVQSFVSLKFLREFLFPLPPLAEQKRIVEKIEELLPLVEKLK